MSDSDPSSIPASSAAPPVSANTGAKLSGRVATFDDQIEVFFDHALPRFGTPYTHVYQARTMRGGPVLAYVSERGAMPRLQLAEKYVTLQNTAFPRLIEQGVLKCPDGIERYSFFYEHTLGQPIVENGDGLAFGWKPDVVLASVLKPMVGMLQELHNADLVHGAIRVNNTFDGGGLPLQRVVSGDILSSNYMAAQPLLYVPPNMWPASPMGRGLGERTDDMYALGVMCAILLRTHDPMEGKTDEQIFLNKLDLGSLSTMIENERLPSNVMELLRGLLHDDPLVRWNIQDVFDWLEGKRTTHRQGNRRLKASRHLTLGDQKILLPSVFSYYASHDVPAAIKLVENGDIKQWIRRSISDARLDHRYDEAVDSSAGDSQSVSSSPDRIVSRLSVAMEPTYPLMYRGVSVYPESFGAVLADLMITAQDVRPIVDLINDQAVSFWMNMQVDIPADFNHMVSRFEQCQQFIKQKSIGYGVERCVYFLTSDLQCLSPSLKSFCVYTPEQLLQSLNMIAERPDRPERILDRHMVAFLSVRDRKVVDRYLPDLGAQDYHRMITGTVSILSAIQVGGKLPPAVALTRWIHQLVEPLYERFHDRDTRVQLAKKMADLKDQGYINKISDLIFDPEKIKRDQYDYRVASQEYYALRQEKYHLTESLRYQKQFGTQAGRDAGALIAGIIMALAVAGFVLMRITEGVTPW